MVFAFFSIISVFLYPILQKIIKKNKSKHIYCVIMCLLFILLIGFRSSVIGTDTPGYVDAFISASPFSWSLLKEILMNNEFGFYFFQSIVRLFTDSYTVFFLLVSFLFIIPLSVFIYRYSEMPNISYLIFMSMGYLNFSMAGLRQTMAMGLLIVSFLILQKKRYFWSIIICLIASLFHITSLIFLLYLLFTKKRISLLHIFLTILICIMCLIFGQVFLSRVLEIIWGETRNYSFEEFGGYSTLVLLTIVAIFALIFNKQITSAESLTNNEDAYFFKYLLISIPFQLLAIYQANCFRIAMYFSIFPMMTLIPKTLSKQEDKLTKYLGTIFVIILLFVQLFVFTYWTSDVNPYKFFWQEV